MWLVHKQPKCQFRVITTPNSSKVCRLHNPCFSPRLTFVSVNCPMQKSLYSTQREGSKICQTDPVVISCIWLFITGNDLWSHPVTKDSYGSQSWIKAGLGELSWYISATFFKVSMRASRVSFDLFHNTIVPAGTLVLTLIKNWTSCLKLINNSWRENKENHYREGGLDMWS